MTLVELMDLVREKQRLDAKAIDDGLVALGYDTCSVLGLTMEIERGPDLLLSRWVIKDESGKVIMRGERKPISLLPEHP